MWTTVINYSKNTVKIQSGGVEWPVDIRVGKGPAFHMIPHGQAGLNQRLPHRCFYSTVFHIQNVNTVDNYA